MDLEPAQEVGEATYKAQAETGVKVITSDCGYKRRDALPGRSSARPWGSHYHARLHHRRVHIEHIASYLLPGSRAPYTWPAAGITCEHELFVTSIALLSLSALFILAGWYYQHVTVPVATWFDLEYLAA